MPARPATSAGTATLSFELILRLSALLARNDPIPFVAQMLRGSNPALWRLLEDWGLGRIPLQLERERQSRAGVRPTRSVEARIRVSSCQPG